jgi:cytochrome c553
MKKLIAVAALAALTVQGALAADIAAGAKLADAQCAACHGKDGKTPTDPTYPKIAGQYSDYLLKALNDYHKGLRKNPVMAAIAKPLSKSDMENLAAYFGSLPGPLTHRK